MFLFFYFLIVRTRRLAHPGRHRRVRARFFAPYSGLSCHEVPQPPPKGAAEPWIDGEFSTSWPRDGLEVQLTLDWANDTSELALVQLQ